ncbi:MAG: division/cell wall cluster transcriptional repressor MraZ [Bacilli bacterium]|nr:division/cell wall cluster transcriptional repressor MraZ [Acholeplasmataceae bacterium]MDY2901835.1 division/cell wall cluster transcriptional repressor MraZ [Bacilli bacterium]
MDNNYGFIGEYNFNIDDSHRLNIPNSFKKQLDGSFVIAKGFEKCLYVFSGETWHELSIKLNSLSITKEKNRKFNRSFNSGAYEVELDSKGRIVIAQKLIDYAQLKKECTIIGVGNRIEIWDTETYDKYLEENEDLIPAISEELDI